MNKYVLQRISVPLLREPPQRSGGYRCALLPWLMPALTGGARTRTRVPVEARRCAPVALRQLQGLACLGDGRASADHHAVQGETAMPLYEKGDVRIHYEEVGSGFPLLVIPGGGLNSTVAGLAHHPFNPMEEFKDEYRVIAADLRNANGGESSGPLEIDRPWDAYTDDHLGLMDHLGISEFMVLGFCIGGPFIWNLLKRAPGRIVAAVLAQPSGFRPAMPDLFYQNNIKGWGPPLFERRPDITMAMVDAFLSKMYRSNADFVFTVTRDFVRSCQTPILVLPDDVP